MRGQWGTVDPLWPWQKAYQYVDGNPAMEVDPTGLAAPLLGLLGIALAGCLVEVFVSGAAYVLSSPYKPQDPNIRCKLTSVRPRVPLCRSHLNKNDRFPWASFRISIVANPDACPNLSWSYSALDSTQQILHNWLFGYL